MEEQRLINLKEKIEKMTKTQHIEILKILKNHKTAKLNENKNGVYVNLSFLKPAILEEMEKYVEYVEIQNQLLTPPATAV